MPNQTMINLPYGWFETSLDNIVEWGSGGTPKRSESSYYGGDIPWVKTGDLGPKKIKTASEFITELGVQKSSAKLFKKGSVALAMYGATIGKTSILDFDATTNQACAVGQPIEGLTETEFLYYLIKNEKQNFINKGKGGAQPNISQQIIKAHTIGFPPLAEQKRIVEKLDSLLAQVETIQQRLNNLPKIIKRFRQSVLAAAVSGKLTEEWHMEHNCKSWKTVSLGDVVTPISQGWSPKCNNVPAPDGKWGVIKTSAVQSIRFVEEENKELPDTLEPREKLLIQDGDILVTRAGPRVRCGITCLVTKVKSKLMICDKVYRFQVKESYGINKFLVLQLNSLKYLEYIEKLKTGISDSGMNLTQVKFKKLRLDWPDIKEQTEIVRIVEQHFALADTLEKNLKNAKKRVDNLTQSILAKAFRGELVPQDPNDEPAEQLLARIKAARAEAELLEKAAKKVSSKTKAKS